MDASSGQLILSTESEPTWYLRERGRSLGRYSLSELRKMGERQQLTRFHSLSTDRRSWEPALDVLADIDAQQALALAPPPPPPVVPTEHQVSFRPFPVALLVVLHFLTLGLWSFFWLPMMHGRLPRRTPSDLTGGQAVMLMLIPIYATIFSFRCFTSLADRLNAIREHYGMVGDIPKKPILMMCVLRLIVRFVMASGSLAMLILFLRDSPIEDTIWFFFLAPQILTLINFMFLVPVLLTMTQSTFNDVAEAQQGELMSNFSAA